MPILGQGTVRLPMHLKSTVTRAPGYRTNSTAPKHRGDHIIPNRCQLLATWLGFGGNLSQYCDLVTARRLRLLRRPYREIPGDINVVSIAPDSLSVSKFHLVYQRW